MIAVPDLGPKKLRRAMCATTGWHTHLELWARFLRRNRPARILLVSEA
jgi:hypothetical protein